MGGSLVCVPPTFKYAATRMILFCFLTGDYWRGLAHGLIGAPANFTDLCGKMAGLLKAVRQARQGNRLGV